MLKFKELLKQKVYCNTLLLLAFIGYLISGGRISSTLSIPSEITSAFILSCYMKNIIFPFGGINFSYLQKRESAFYSCFYSFPLKKTGLAKLLLSIK